MIFNITVLKRLMKTAYNGAGLLVANYNGTIILGGSYWRLQVYENYFPKKAKASLVELIGQLPMMGESFRCTKDGNQMELPGEDLGEVANEIDWSNPYEKTKVLLESTLRYVRPYQNKKTDTIFLNEVFSQLLTGDTEPGESCSINGPCKRNESEYNRVFFSSDTCILEAYTIVPKAEHGMDPKTSQLERTMSEFANMELPK